MSDLERGSIKFFQACLPPLLPGDYTVAVDQTVKEARPEPFRTELEFSIAGPRFSLNPADVYSVYPPANQSGEFGNTLPHIVLTRRTLPWERTMEGADPDEKTPCPWLALLVLSRSDFPLGAELPKIQARKVEALFSPGKGIKGPNLMASDLKQYESVDDLCNTIDLPKALFSSIVPAKADLPYLAHVREVDTGNKETASLKTEGCFSVVLANRFPETAESEAARNMAVLVSLEGFQNYLHGETGIIAEATVRLAVLANWSFLCQGKNTFKTLVNKLKTDLLRLTPSEENAGKEGMDEVIKAFALGYTALNHHIRNGEITVSWYRGPLVPIFYRKDDVYRYLPCADAALRYNYETGLLDATYAAAWQLGRLLALQSPHFAQAMYRCRNQERQKTKLQIANAVRNDRYQLSGKDMDERLTDEMRSNPGAFK
jgi:hypothetical protein